MKSATLILPNGIFKDNPAINTSDKILIFEDSYFFTRLNYHKKKLILHRASLKSYFKFLNSKKFSVDYLEFKEDLFDYLKKNKITRINLVDPIEKILKKDLLNKSKKNNIEIVFYKAPNFINTQQSIEELLGKKDKYNFTSFYIKLRKASNILITNSKPVGGKWTYDKYNRQSIPQDTEIPKFWVPKKNKFVDEAIEYIENNFKNNPGLSKDFFYPIDFDDAQFWLDDFLKHRFKYFGNYQDAIKSNNILLFHSLLSPLLNIGLLTPDFVINKALEFYNKKLIPLNSCEGFIRQILGWREFIYGIYLLKSEIEIKSNFFEHKRKLPYSFWEATTGIEPIDITIKKILETSYAHHIERLMILGNFMLLCEFDPDDIYKWFMELFIDAYDWVMVPNVYGMSQYADSGLITTKPYFSSSNYIKKMSDFKSGLWSDIWDALYWRFIYKNKKPFAHNPRIAVMVWQINKMEKNKINNYVKLADKFLNNLE